MKIINIHRNISNQELSAFLEQKLNPLFQRHKESNINFLTTDNGNSVAISQPEFYEGNLFDIEIKGEELWITRSEHYVDDVNSLTLESVLNELFEELAGDKGVAIVQEG